MGAAGAWCRHDQELNRRFARGGWRWTEHVAAPETPELDDVGPVRTVPSAPASPVSYQLARSGDRLLPGYSAHPEATDRTSQG